MSLQLSKLIIIIGNSSHDMSLFCFQKKYFIKLSTSDLTGRRLKHSFPASIALSCSLRLKCASASRWYACVKID